MAWSISTGFVGGVGGPPPRRSRIREKARNPCNRPAGRPTNQVTASAISYMTPGCAVQDNHTLGKGLEMNKKAMAGFIGITLLVIVGLLLAQDPPRGPGMDGPPAGRRGPGGRFGPRGDAASSMSKAPLAKDEVEKKILAVLDELNRSGGRGMMNVPPEDGRFLRLLAETTGAKHIVEIGTSNGYSGIWQCLALKASGGKLTTFEIDAGRAALARQNFKKAGVDGIVTLIEGDAHEKVLEVKGPIDMCFIDADKEGYTDYLNKLLPKVRPGGLIVAHNITPGMADPQYIEAITTSPDLETIFYQQGGGISVTLKKHGLE